MSYSVDLENDYLRCKTEAAAHRAAALINADPWMHYHLHVAPVLRTFPGRADSWHLAIEDYDGCSWNEPSARNVWFALAPFMASGAVMEFCTEDRERYRIHWFRGRVYAEYPKRIIWAVECELNGKEEP